MITKVIITDTPLVKHYDQLYLLFQEALSQVLHSFEFLLVYTCCLSQIPIKDLAAHQVSDFLTIQVDKNCSSATLLSSKKVKCITIFTFFHIQQPSSEGYQEEHMRRAHGSSFRRFIEVPIMIPHGTPVGSLATIDLIVE